MISTPIRPTAVAIQRRTPTFSPRKTIDSAVTNSGATKPVAEASAIGRKRRPEMKNSDEPSSAAPRINCRPDAAGLQREQRRARHHRRRHDQREHQEADPGDLDRGQRRREIFRGDVGDAEKHRRGQDQRDALERPVGARGRACGAAGFFSGNGNGALSSLAAAAGGGVTAISRREISNLGEALKNDNWPESTRSENRMRICADARSAETIC